MTRWTLRLMLTACLSSTLIIPATASANAVDPGAATATPIRHFVMLMQSNHSFDNYFGTYPGAAGIPPGVCMPADNRKPNTNGCVVPFHVDNRPPENLQHNAGTQAAQYNKGKMNGFVSTYRSKGQDGSITMGHYDQSDLPFYRNVADQYVLFDHFFSSATGGSRLNHFYWFTGQPTPGGSEQVPPGGYGQIPTIFDELEARGISWKVYVENYNPKNNLNTQPASAQGSQTIKVPLLEYSRYVDNPQLAGHIVDLSQYMTDLAAGSLPAVSYIVTRNSSENPPGRIQSGERLVQRLVNSLIQSQSWPSSAFMWTYDGWGGWYDHVPPPLVDQYGYGFRVPALLVSPYARRGFVNHTLLDYTAAMKFIESNWNIPPLAKRDATSAGLDGAFDFGAPARQAALISPTRDTQAGVNAIHNHVYPLYGGAAVVAVGVVAFAFTADRLRRRRGIRFRKEIAR